MCVERERVEREREKATEGVHATETPLVCVPTERRLDLDAGAGPHTTTCPHNAMCLHTTMYASSY